MFTYSVSTAVVGRIPRRVALEQIAASGFDTVELTSDPGQLDDWLNDPAGMRRDLERLGLRAASIHIPAAAWSMAHPDAAHLEEIHTLAAAALRAAAEVGADVVVCHPNGPGAEFTEADYAAGLARSRASMVRLAEVARPLGVRLALENLPRRHQPRPGGSMAEILALVEGLGEHVGVILDVGHATANGLRAADEALLCGPQLFALHLQDNDGLGEDQHLLPGQGVTDWDALLGALRAMDFRGLATFEIGTREDVAGTLAALAALRDQPSWNGNGAAQSK